MSSRASKRRKGDKGADIPMREGKAGASAKKAGGKSSSTLAVGRKRRRGADTSSDEDDEDDDEGDDDLSTADRAERVHRLQAAIEGLKKEYTGTKSSAPAGIWHSRPEAALQHLMLGVATQREQLLDPPSLLRYLDETEAAVVDSGVPPEPQAVLAAGKGRTKRRTANLSLEERLMHAHIDRRLDLSRPFWPRFRCTGGFTLDGLGGDLKPSLYVSLHLHGFALNDGPIEPYTPLARAFLRACDEHRIQMDFVRILEARVPLQYYNGCLVVELREFRVAVAATSASAGAVYRTRRVVLHPTPTSLHADLVQLHQEEWAGTWTEDEALSVERALIKAVSGPLCLEPTTRVFQLANVLAYNERAFCAAADSEIAAAVRPFRLQTRVRGAHAAGLPAQSKISLLHFLTESKRHGKATGSVQVDAMAAAPFAPVPASEDLSALAASALPKSGAPAGRRPKRTIKFNAVGPRSSRQCMAAFCVLEITALPSGQYEGLLRLGMGEDLGTNGSVVVYPLGSEQQTHRYVDQFVRLYEKEGNACCYDSDLATGADAGQST